MSSGAGGVPETVQYCQKCLGGVQMADERWSVAGTPHEVPGCRPRPSRSLLGADRVVRAALAGPSPLRDAVTIAAGLPAGAPT